MKNITHLLGLLVCSTIFFTAPKVAAQEDPNYTTRIIGTWVNTTSKPTRIPTFKEDGTFACAYVGSMEIKSGTWSIKGRSLFRTFANGNKQISRILELKNQRMTLQTSVNSLVQVDRYTRYVAH